MTKSKQTKKLIHVIHIYTHNGLADTLYFSMLGQAVARMNSIKRVLSGYGHSVQVSDHDLDCYPVEIRVHETDYTAQLSSHEVDKNE